MAISPTRSLQTLLVFIVVVVVHRIQIISSTGTDGTDHSPTENVPSTSDTVDSSKDRVSPISGSLGLSTGREGFISGGLNPSPENVATTSGRAGSSKDKHVAPAFDRTGLSLGYEGFDSGSPDSSPEHVHLIHDSADPSKENLAFLFGSTGLSRENVSLQLGNVSLAKENIAFSSDGAGPSMENMPFPFGSVGPSSRHNVGYPSDSKGPAMANIASPSDSAGTSIAQNVVSPSDRPGPSSRQRVDFPSGSADASIRNVAFPSSSVDPLSGNVASTSAGGGIPNIPITRNDRADVFIMNWNNVNLAIGAFIQEFERRHEVTILPNRDLEETDLFEAGFNLIYGATRLKFSYEKGGQTFQSSVIFKISTLGPMHPTGIKMHFYVKERYMYENVLPEMYRLWPYVENLSPEFYLFTDTGILVIENLRETGFFTTDNVLVDVSTCATVFATLAQFHALSIAAMKQEVSNYLDSVTVVDRGANIFKDRTFHAIVGKFRKNLLPLLEPNHVKLFEEMITSARFLIQISYSPDDNGLNVLIHGDPTRMNVFLRSDPANTTIAGCKLMDFQNTRRGPPVLDLINYLATSVEKNVFPMYSDSLLNFYVEQFQKTLALVAGNNLIQYGREELDAQLRKYKLVFVYLLVCKTPLYWTRHARLGTGNEVDEYDVLLKSDEFISFFRSWMDILFTW